MKGVFLFLCVVVKAHGLLSPHFSGAAMMHLNRSLALALLVTVGTCVGCSGGSDSSSTTTTPTLTADTLAGTVPAPIGGVRQAASVLFTVNAPGGTVGVTLTSAVQPNPDGSVNPNV